MSRRNLKAMVFGSILVLSTIDLANAEDSAHFPSFRPDIPEESPRGWTICNESKKSRRDIILKYLRRLTDFLGLKLEIALYPDPDDTCCV